MTLGEGGAGSGGGGGSVGSRRRTVQWVVERDGSGMYRDHTPSIRIKLNGGMFRTLPMMNITHAADVSLWVCEVSLPSSMVGIKYAIRMTPQRYSSPPAPLALSSGTSPLVPHTAISQPDTQAAQPHPPERKSEETLELRGDWLVVKRSGHPAEHIPLKNSGAHTLFINHLPGLESQVPMIHLSMVGSSETLGAWDPTKQLVPTVSMNNGIWISPVMLEPGIAVEYKLIIDSPYAPPCCYDDNTGYSWETFNNPFLNRSFTPQERNNMAVYSRWSNYDNNKITAIPHNQFLVYADQSIPPQVVQTEAMSSVLSSLFPGPEMGSHIIGDGGATLKKEKLPPPTQAQLAQAATGVVTTVVSSALRAIYLDIEIARQALEAKLCIIARGIIRRAIKAALQIVGRSMDHRIAIMAKKIVKDTVAFALFILDSESSLKVKKTQLSVLAKHTVEDAVAGTLDLIDAERGTDTEDREEADPDTAAYKLADGMFHGTEIGAEDIDRIMEELTTQFVDQVTMAAKDDALEDLRRFSNNPVASQEDNDDETETDRTSAVVQGADRSAKWVNQLVDEALEDVPRFSSNPLVYQEEEDKETEIKAASACVEGANGSAKLVGKALEDLHRFTSNPEKDDVETETASGGVNQLADKALEDLCKFTSNPITSQEDDGEKTVTETASAGEQGDDKAENHIVQLVDRVMQDLCRFTSNTFPSKKTNKTKTTTAAPKRDKVQKECNKLGKESNVILKEKNMSGEEHINASGEEPSINNLEKTKQKSPPHHDDSWVIITHSDVISVQQILDQAYAAPLHDKLPSETTPPHDKISNETTPPHDKLSADDTNPPHDKISNDTTPPHDKLSTLKPGEAADITPTTPSVVRDTLEPPQQLFMLEKKDGTRPKLLLNGVGGSELGSGGGVVKECLSAEVSSTQLSLKHLREEVAIEHQHSDCTFHRPPPAHTKCKISDRVWKKTMEDRGMSPTRNKRRTPK